MKARMYFQQNIAQFGWCIQCDVNNLNMNSTAHGLDWYTDASKRAQWQTQIYPNNTSLNQIQDFPSIDVENGDTIYWGFDTTGGSNVNLTIQITIDGVTKYSRSLNNIASGFGSYTVGSLKSGAPTYLETLDKLDQWSSAQYIPNSRNKLNL